MGTPRHRLFAAPVGLLLAAVVAFALLVLMRPSGAFAASGPVAVNSVESSDVALHTPRRAATSVDKDLRGFVSALHSEIDVWCSCAPSVGVCVLAATSTDAACGRPLRCAQPRGPPR